MPIKNENALPAPFRTQNKHKAPKNAVVVTVLLVVVVVVMAHRRGPLAPLVTGLTGHRRRHVYCAGIAVPVLEMTA